MKTNYSKNWLIKSCGILSFNLIFSCNNDISTKKLVDIQKNEDGHVEYEKFLMKNNDTFDTEYNLYYPNGNLKRVFHEKNLKNNGNDICFYSNGRIESEGEWLLGRKYGMFKYYDSLGKLRKMIQYINYLDSAISRPNQIIVFNSKGDTVKDQSFYFDEYISKDTINLDKEQYWFKIVLTAPLFKEAYLKLCDYDEKYNLTSDSTCNIAHMKNFEVMLAPKKYHLGKNVIRGAIVNYQIFKDIYNKDSLTQANIYFADSFYVVH